MTEYSVNSCRLSNNTVGIAVILCLLSEELGQVPSLVINTVYTTGRSLLRVQDIISDVEVSDDNVTIKGTR